MDPPVMALNDDRFKVVFLTDIRRWSSDKHDSNVLHKCTASVRLSVLKLLTYFAHGTAAQPTHLRWGYKFFNSIDVPPCKRETLKEFTEGSLETFEEQLLQEVESGVTLTKRSESLSKSEKTVKSTGESVRHALSDVLQDFQWEGPDIRSPVKAASTSVAGRTRHKAAAVAAASTAAESPQLSSKSNFVFLFMPCPHHQSNVREFFGIRKMEGTRFTTEEFRDYIAPPDGGLPEKLKQNAISIYWIDTAPLHAKNQKVPEGDRHGLSIASQAMRQLGGAVISINTLLSLNKQDLNLYLQSTLTKIGLQSYMSGPSREEEQNSILEDFQSETEEGDEEETEMAHQKSRRKDVARSFFPWSSVISHYVREVPSSGGVGLFDPDESFMLCTKQGYRMIQHCKLKLQPLFGSHTFSHAANFPSEVSRPATLPSPSSKSLEADPEGKGAPCTINVHSGDVGFQITKLSCDASASTADEDEISSGIACDNETEPQLGSPSNKSVECYFKELEGYLKKKTLCIRGIVPTQSLFLGVHYEDRACTCTGVALDKSSDASDIGQNVEEKEEEEDTSVDKILTLSSWFKKTMIHLNQKKLALLVEMHDMTSGLPMSAVLEPLTAITASLRVIKPSMVRSVERMMRAFHQDKVSGRDDDNEETAAARLSSSGVVSDAVMARIGNVAKRCVKERAGGHRPRRKSSNRAHSIGISSGLQGRAQRAMSRFQPHHLEAWYHKGPTHGVPVKFIEHLKEIPEDLSKQCDQSHSTLDKLLYDLEVTYEQQAMRAQNGTDTTQVKEVQPKKTLNLVPRTVSIMRQSLKQAHTKKKPPSPATKEKQKTAGKVNHNKAYCEIVAKGKSRFTSEEDLLAHLKATYNKVLSGKSDLMTYIFKTIPIILLFAKSKCPAKVVKDLTEELVEHARKITTNALLINNAQLRGQYKNMNDKDSMERRVKEVEMQVLLRLEMEALLPTEIESQKPPEKKVKEEKEEEDSKTGVLDISSSEDVALPDELREIVDEMVTMLQSIPILVDHSRLTTFLEDVTSNYRKILGPILKVVYDDLMISKPEELMSPTMNSQASVKPPSSMEPPSSYGSVTMRSSSSVAQRSRSLVRHPSFDVGSKRVIPVVIKKEATKKTKEKKKQKKEQEDDQAKRVCRNLFSGGGSEGPIRRSPRKKFNRLPRRQSVAVMETAANRWKSPRRRTPGKSPSRLVLKTRTVKETPGKKQVVQAMLRKQERARKETKLDKSAEEAAIEESPDKVVKETPHPKKRTTPGKSHPKLTRHHSHKHLFYSKKSPKSARGKNLKAKEELSKAINLGARIAGKTPEAKPVSTRLLHTRTQSASAVRVFSNYASPATLLQQRKIPIKKETEDSPSKNTRSHVFVIPEVLSSPKSSKKSPSKSPRRVANRALWKSPEKSIPEVLSSPKSSKKSPSKSPRRVANRALWKSPEKSIPEVLSSPKSSKKSPSKSPRRVANRALWKSPEKLLQQSAFKSPSKTPQKIARHITVEDTPDKSAQAGGLPRISPKKGYPVKTSKKSPSKMITRTPKKGSPDRLKKSPSKKGSPNRTPEKSLSKMTTRTPKKGSSNRTPKKLSPSKKLTRTSTPVKVTTTPNKNPLKKGVKVPSSRIPDSKRKASSPQKTLENLDVDHVMSQTRRNRATASAPCELCSTGDKHSHSSRPSSSFWHISDISTSSSLEDVFESPSSGVKSPSRKTSGTPELIRVWKQKKSQNDTPPKSGKLSSPRSTTKSASPVFGTEAAPAKRPSTSPYASKRQRIVRQPAGEERLTSSPTFGKHTPSPRRRKSSRSPGSARKQSKTSSGKGGSAKKSKRPKKSDNTSGSILSWLDIKGMKGQKEVAAIQKEETTLLEVAESQHKENQETRSRKRGRNEEDEEDARLFKKQKSVQDDDVVLVSDDEELYDIDRLLDISGNSDEEIAITYPTGIVDLKLIDSENTVDFESVKEFVSPPKKKMTTRSPRVTRKKSSELQHTASKIENVVVSYGDKGDSGKSKISQESCEIETNEPNSASVSGVRKQTHSKPRSFRRLPTRRSLAKRMSSGDSSTSDHVMVMSPMFSDDSLALSEEDEDLKYPTVSQEAKCATSSEPNKKLFTPISKKGLVDLMNSPLVSSAERLKSKTRDKGTSSRRHVSFSSE